VYVVPDASFSWAKEALAEELVEKHKAVGADVPHFFYMDCVCCNGKPSFRDRALHVPASPPNDDTASVAALWRSIFCVKLDVMHLILRIGREMNAEHSYKPALQKRWQTLADIPPSCIIQASLLNSLRQK